MTNESKNDIELVKLALQKADNFCFIIEKYEKKLFWYIKRISNFCDEEIEDLLQEIFIKVYRNLNNYNNKLQFSSWIYRIARNETISLFRKRKKQLSDVSLDWDIDENLLKQLKFDFNIYNELDNKELNKQIYKILNLMDLKYREVLIYKYFEEKSYEEISDITKKPVATVGTLINRAKKQFNNILETNNISL
jgi:RNA polymerase sigma-70 factor, ECF subfamily